MPRASAAGVSPMRVSVTRLLAASSLVLGITACGSQDVEGSASALRESAVAVPSSTGTDFWLMFPAQADAYYSYYVPTIEVLLGGDVATDGVVEVPGLGVTQPFSIVPGSTTAVVLPSGARMKSSD